MALKSRLYGWWKKGKEWINLILTEEGSVSTAEHGATFKNYKFVDSTITTGTDITYRCRDDLGRNCNNGYFFNDSPGSDNITMTIHSGEVVNDAITIEPGEILTLGGMNASVVVLSTTGTNVPFRIMMK